MTEKELEDLILSYLNERGYFAFKVPDQRQFTGGTYRKHKWMPRGIPDICCIKPTGETVWIEVKTPAGKLSKQQTTFFNKLIKFNVNCKIARKLDDVKNL